MSVLTAALGAVMMASSLGAKFAGLPRQIAVNRRRGTASHASRWFAALGMVSYSSTSLWCFLEGAWPAGAAAVPGALIIAVLLWQTIAYPDSG